MVDGQETIVNGTYKLIENPTVLPVWKWFTAPVEVLFSSDGPLVVFVIFLSVMVGGIYYVLDKADVLKRMIAWIYRKFGKQKYFILFFMTSLFLQDRRGILARHSCSCSSMILSQRTLRPSMVLSSTKS